MTMETLGFPKDLAPCVIKTSLAILKIYVALVGHVHANSPISLAILGGVLSELVE